MTTVEQLDEMRAENAKLRELLGIDQWGPEWEPANIKEIAATEVRKLVGHERDKLRAQRDAVIDLCREPCREWIEEKADRCKVVSEFILWGKLFPSEALGPRCYEHASQHLGGWMSYADIEQHAVFDLRRIRAVLEDA